MNYTAKTTNLEFLKNFTKGDKDKIKRYIGMYLSTTPQVILDMEKFLEENDFESVRLKAHSIKPQVQYMGIAELSALLLQIESIIDQKQEISQLPALITSVKTINDKATIELKQFLDEL
jgi:HPt (histidine-containing phosphotransfer) domain-containing protein